MRVPKKSTAEEGLPYMLNIVIPVRDERDSIKPLFDKFVSAMSDYSKPYKIIAVDGVSSDGTPDLIREYSDRLPIEVVELKENLGLGGALEVGLLKALKNGADTVVTMDGDDSHDPHTIHTMLAKLNDGYDLIVASRFEPGGEEVGVAGYRKVLSHTASGVLRFLFPVGEVKDYSSGFRAYRADVLRRVHEKNGRLVNESGFSCMMEVLLQLRAAGIRAAEVPLVLRYDLKQSDTKMSIGHTVYRYVIVISKNLRFARGLNRPMGQAA
jgi:dolichol-phosphate mannosyltransferase